MARRTTESYRGVRRAEDNAGSGGADRWNRLSYLPKGASVMRFGRGERGSAPVEAAFAIFFLMLLTLGVVQVILSLYARNVVISSAHEGARAAIELGRSEADGEAVARRTVSGAVGKLVDGLKVSATVRETGGLITTRVRVRGVVRPVGPVPIPLPIDATAVATARRSSE